MVSERSDAQWFVFVDEMGANTSLSPLRAWSRRGERAHCSVPRNRGKNTTLLASMSVEGMGPALAVESVTNRAVFEVYVEGVLAPSLRHGQIVVMDNLGAHKGERIKERIEERGCQLLYLPPYSPDLNPIEEAFSKIKVSCARRRLEAGRRWSKLWARRSTRSPPRMREAFSSTADTEYRFNRYERRCRRRLFSITSRTSQCSKALRR